MLKRWPLLLFVLTLQASALDYRLAHAQARLAMDERVGSVEGWTVGYNSSVEGCLASITYSDETTFWFGIDGRDRNTYLALTNPNWQSIESGKQYDLRFVALGGSRWHGKFFGIARDSEKGIISSGLKENFVRELALSSGVAISIGSRTVARLGLQGSPAAMAAVTQCQSERNASGNPRKPGNSNVGPRVVGNGTGFFVTGNGHVLTNHHVINGCVALEVQQPGGSSREARLIASDKNNDLAVIITELKPPSVAPLRNEVRLGEDIAVFGFPLLDSLASAGNFTVGNVTALAGMADNSSEVQISAPIQPGNSGGPVLDRRGNVVAVIRSTATSAIIASASEIPRVMPQNVNFAIKSVVAMAFLNASGIHTDGQINTTAAFPTADLADRAKAYSVKVLCKK